MTALVAFYSRTDEKYIEVGNTEKTAKMIAELTDADLFKIEQKNPYSADYSSCIAEAKKDLKANARPELKSLPDSIDKYDEIYLGYPKYWGTMPMAVYTFLELFDFGGKTIHPFCAHEGSGLAGTESDIRKTAKGAVVANGLAIHGSAADSAESKAEKWLKS